MRFPARIGLLLALAIWVFAPATIQSAPSPEVSLPSWDSSPELSPSKGNATSAFTIASAGDDDDDGGGRSNNGGGHGDGDDDEDNGRGKLRFQTAPVDNPDPFTPPTESSTLAVQLGAQRTGSDDSDGKSPWKYYVRLTWTLSQNQSIVRQIVSQKDVAPPRKHRGRDFIPVDFALTWDGRTSSGALAPAGSYPYTVYGELYRVRENKKSTQTEKLDETERRSGSVTIRSGRPAPTIAIVRPSEGTLTNLTTILVEGTVTGDAPLVVTVNGQAATVTNGAFSATIGIQEGLNTITARVTDPGSQSAEQSVVITRDATPPQLRVDQPATGSTLSDPHPTFLVSYSDANLELASFRAVLDGEEISARFSKSLLSATYTVTAENALAEGSHSFSVFINDRAGNTSTATSSFSIATPAPTLILTQPSDGEITRQPSTVVQGSVTGRAPLSVTVNGQSVPVSSGTFSISVPLAEGTNTLAVVVTDGVGRNASVSLAVVRDSIAPHVAIELPATSSTIGENDPQFVVSYSDPAPATGLLLASFRAHLDGTADISGEFTQTASGATFQVPPTDRLPDGVHTLEVSITDAAGNSATATSTFTVHTTPPTLTVASPADGSLTREDAVQVEGTVSGRSPLTVTVQGQAIPVFDGTFSTRIALAEGPNAIALLVVDGNARSIEQTITVTRDSQAPQIVFDHPSHGATLGENNPQFRVSYSDPAPASGLDLSSFSARLDGQLLTFAATPSSATYQVASTQRLTEGPHVLEVAIQDRAGNSASARSEFTVQTTPPTLTITSPADGAVTRDNTGLVQGTVSGRDPLSVTVNGQPAAVAAGTYSRMITLVEGTNELLVRATDGNDRSAELSRTVLRDSISPVISITSPSANAILRGNQPLIEVTFADPSPSSGLSLSSFRALHQGQDISSRFTVTSTGATYQVSPENPFTEGLHTVEVLVEDAAGNRGGASIAFRVDSAPPVLALVPTHGSFLRSTSPDLVATFSDPSPSSGIYAGSFTATFDGIDQSTAFAVTTSEARWTVTPALSDGTHTFVATIADQAGNTTSRTSTFSIDSTAPFLTSSIAPGATLRQPTPNLVATYADPTPSSGLIQDSFRAILDGTDITGSFQVGALQASFQIPESSPLGDGTHTLQYRIEDAAGNHTVLEVTFTVDSTPPGIAIVSPTDGTEIDTSTPTLEISYQDPAPGSGVLLSSLSVRLDGTDITAGVAATSARAVYIVTSGNRLRAGSHSLVATISDNAGNSSTTTSNFSVSASSAPPPETADSGFATGLVLNGVSGAPLPGAKVTVEGQPGIVFTDDSGRYVFPLPDGEYRIQIAATGYTGPIERTVSIDATREQSVEEVLLFPVDSQVTEIDGVDGGTATNSQGTITIEFPPGSLSEDAEVRITAMEDTESLPDGSSANLIPGTIAEIDLGGASVEEPVTVYFDNVAGLEPGHQVFVQSFNEESGCWEISGGGAVTADGSSIQVQVTHFSIVGLHCGRTAAVDEGPNMGGAGGPPPCDTCGAGAGGSGSDSGFT